jgi:hypothetical protein
MNVDRRVFGWVLALCLLTPALHAQAGGIFVPSDDLANGMLQNMMAQDLLKNSLVKKKKQPPPAALMSSVVVTSTPGSALAETGAPLVPAKLAATYPENQRAVAASTYLQVLQGYRGIESRLGIPRNDVGGAVAAFIAGSWMAYRDSDLPDRHFKALVSQMQQIVSSNPRFQAAAATERQEFFEQMAILGTTMALTREGLKGRPDPSVQARLRQTAGGYLNQFLGIDAERVVISANGLRFD